MRNFIQGCPALWHFYHLEKLLGRTKLKKAREAAALQQRLRARRGPMRSKPRSHQPNHFWGVDMTKIKIYPWGWLYLCVVLDWGTKEIVGYSLSIQSKTDDWLEAVEMAVNNRFPKRHSRIS